MERIEDNEFSIYDFHSIKNYVTDNFVQILLLFLVFLIIYAVDYISNINTIIMAQMNNISIHKPKTRKISRK